MRIVLLYPPPWKIAAPGSAPYPPEEGPPDGVPSDAVDGGDLVQAPYGMLSLAAQLIKAGLETVVFNMSNFPWPAVELLISQIEADVFGLTCHTANRRGVALLAKLIRKVYPKSVVVVGGPHVSALPEQTLRHFPEIDLVVIGEGERTLMEIVGRVQAGIPLEGIKGSAWRNGGDCRVGGTRELIEDLDQLASPADFFCLRTILTSRGCPMDCTFCCSKLMWRRRVRFHSVGYVLDMLEKLVNGRGQKIIAFKDDTFTADKRRALSICRGIRERKLEFMWSCDSRADYLDEQLLRAMHSAGCIRISLGVESASEEVLKNIRKKVSPERILKITRTAKKYGYLIRYYMMVGNRGETLETFHHSLEFLRIACPGEIVFTQLHLYPGTDEFRLFERAGAVTPEMFFRRRFMTLTAFAGNHRDEKTIRKTLQQLNLSPYQASYSVGDYESMLQCLPESHRLHVDLCRAYLRAGNPAKAEYHLNQAVRLGYFLPGIVLNCRACIAVALEDVPTAESCLEQALHHYPHRVVIENQRRIRSWYADGGQSSGRRLVLAPGDGFETNVVFRQPEFPDTQGFVGSAGG